MAARHEGAFIVSGIFDLCASIANSFRSKPLSKTATPTREIAFIDRDVDDLAALLAGIRPDVEPLLLSNHEPALRQMARAVQGREGLETIHVIAHGRSGELSFSAGALSVETIDQYVAELGIIGTAIGEAGDLRLWSCAVTHGERGAAFFDAIARASGADIAAATGLVGASTRGGSWELSARGVPAKALPPLTSEGQAAYAEVLDTNNTTISGNNSTNTLAVTGSNDKVSDGNGTNSVSVTGNSNAVTDGNGTNTVTVSGNNNTISDGNGSNTIIASGSNETISDGNGGNLIYAAGTNGSNSITDGNGTDVIVGGAGTDTIIAGNGTNIIYGGAGNDTINVGNGSNVIMAGAGSDTVAAGNGSDLAIYALSDHYTISGSTLHSIAGDVDKYNGGGGTDTLRVVVTAAEYAAIKPLLTAYATWLAANAGSNATYSFNFAAGTSGTGISTAGGGLSVTGWESLQVQVVNTGSIILASGATSATGSLNSLGLFNDSVGTSAVNFTDTFKIVGLAAGANGSAATSLDPSLTVAQYLHGTATLPSSYTVAGTDGTLTVNADGSYSYSVTSHATSTDVFTLSTLDQNGFVTSTTLTFGVPATNHAPVAVADVNAAKEDTAPNPVASNVLTNDSDVDASDTHSVTAVNGSAANVGANLSGTYGTLHLNSDGTYTYTLNNAQANVQALADGQTVTDVFNYTNSDNHGGSSTANLTVTVTGTNDAPVAVADVNAVKEDTAPNPVAGNVLTNDSDVDASDTHSVTAVNGSAANVGANLSGTYGTLHLNSDGTYTYTLNNAQANVQALADGQTVTDVFNYTNSDNHGGSSTANLTVTVTGTNDAPVAVADVNAVKEDTAPNPVNGNVLTNDSDVDTLDTHSVTAVNGAAAKVGVDVAGTYGTLHLNANGTYTYTLDNTETSVQALAEGQQVTDVFSYTNSDNHGGSSSANLTITVTGTNDAPVANNDSGTTHEDTVLTVSATNGVLHNDTDVDTSDTLTVSAVNGVAADVGTQITLASGALLTLNADGSYSYDPSTITNIESAPANSTVADSFTYTATDAHGDVSTATVNITVNVPAEPVTATDDVGATVNEDTVLVSATSVLANDLHGSDDPITVSAVNGVAADVGTQITLASGALLTLNADGSYSYDPSTITNIESAPANSTVADSFTYTATDAHGDVSTATVNITVNVPAEPVTATDDVGATVNEDTVLVSATSVLANDLHGSDDPITVSAVNGVAADVGTQITLASGALLTLNADGSYSYDPSTITNIESAPANSTVADSFTYTATDAHGDVSTATVNITVNVPAEPVTATDDVGATVNEDTVLVSATSVLANDLHGSDDPITVSAVNGVAADVGTQITLASGALLTLNADGSYSYDPSTITNIESAPANSTVADSFTYTATDAHGDVSTATVNITVNVPAEPVTATDDVGATVNEDTVLVSATSVLANDLHGSDDPITVSAVNGVAADVGTQITLASGALLTLNADGSYSYDPSTITNIESAPANSTVADSFTYTATDAHGDVSTATVNITVNVPAEPVTATDDVGATVNEDTVLVSATSVLANDLHGSDDPITVSAVNGVAADVGTQITLASGALLTLNADGSYSYDPSTITNIESAPANSTVADSFTYTATDAHGDVSTATVNITVNVPAEPVTATDDVGATVNEDTVLVSATSVLANDLHGSDDPITVSAVNGVAADVGTQITLASGALLTLNADGSYSYDPSTITNIESAPANSTVADSFTYTATDAHGDVSTATVNITVNVPAEPVTATDDVGATVNEDTVLVSATSVLANDLHGSDDPITVSAVNGVAADVGTQITLASGALLTLNADGSYSYDPSTITNIESAPANSTVADSFTYTATDAHGDVSTATVNITVNVPAEPVTATDDVGATVNEDTVLVSATSVLANDLHGSDDPITVSAVNGVAADVGTQITLASGALLTLNADGSYSYDPSTITNIESAPANSTVADSFTYTATDAHGDVSTATVNITVNVPAEPVTATDDVGATVNEDTVLVSATSVLANDLHGSDDPITVSAVNGVAADVGTQITLASGALLTLNADGSYSYDPSTITNIESAPANSTVADSFTYTATDAHGDVSTATVNITVNVPAEPVTATDDVGATVNEDTVLVSATSVLANDLHGSDDPITVSAVNGVAADVGTQITLASGALLTLNADGSYSYDPSTITNIESAPANSTVADSFTYTATDAHGDVSTATVNITVNVPAEPVTATDDVGATVNEDTVLVSATSVLANDLHGSDDPITVSAVNGVAADVGTQITLASGALLTLNADGSYSYDPSTITNIESAPANSTVADSFTYTATDAHGDVSTATVNITVNVPAEPVTATDDVGATVNEDTVLVSATSVLANDLHGSDDPITVSAVNGVAADVGTQITLASGALLTLNADGSYSYDPSTITNIESAPANSTVADSFTYTATDAHGDVSTATVNITVNVPAEPVTATDDVGATVNEDTVLVSATSVLANDLHGSDDPITVSAVNGVAADVGTQITLASGALLTLNADGSYSYDPSTITNIESAPANSTVADSFTYTATDAHGDVSTATVNITVNVPAEPVTASISGTAQEGQVLVANATHDADDTITYQWQSLSGTTWSDISGGTGSTYSVLEADEGHQLRVVVTDNHGTSATATTAAVTDITLSFTSAASISGTAQEGQVLTAVNGTLNDSDASVTGYQWTRDGVNISGATASTYTVTEADETHVLRVVETATDADGGPSTTSTSAPTAAVTDITLAFTSAASISGTAKEGTQLTAVDGALNDSDAHVTGWQWQIASTVNGTYSNIAGATSSTYTPIEADEGKFIRVVETATDIDGGPSTTSTSAPTAAVTDITLAFTSAASISGTAQEGQVLTAVNGTLNDSDASVTGYQWTRDGVNISGATASTYTVTEADETHVLRVVETATDADGGPSTTSTSAPTAAVTDITLAFTSAASISGTAQEGQVLTAVNGTLNDSDASVTGYQWTRDGVNISGATASTYTVTEADETHVLRVVETATDADGGPSTTSTSAPTAAVTDITLAFTSAASISGTAKEGTQLTAVDGALNDSDAHVTGWQWQIASTVNGTYSNIAGATSSTYTPIEADEGKFIRVVETATDIDGGPSTTSTSAPTAAVTDITLAFTSAASISGTAQEGQVLTAVNGTLNDSDASVTGYQWTRDGVNISGATASTYTVTEADETHVLRVVETATDADGGPSTTSTSAPTAAVTEIALQPTITAGTHTATGNNGHVTFIVTFPEAVATVGTNDFTLFGTATSSSNPPAIASISGSGTSYTVTVDYAENKNAGLSLGLNFVNTGNGVHDTETGETGNLAVATNITTAQFSSLAPAGVAGSAINMALTDPTLDVSDAITMTITGVAPDWTLNAGAQNSDGSWTVNTTDPASLAITTSASFAGAAVIHVTETWTNADGSIGSAIVTDNVEAYAPGSPIFALSGDDYLTGSSGHDVFVFSQPIGHDVIYNFDAVSDQVDLIGYAGFTGFGDIQAHTADDGAGNAVITLGDGQSITLHGVDANSLTANDFVFEQTPVTENAGNMVISDGAIMPLSGVIHNAGSIALNSTGDETDLQLIEHGITLEGGGHVDLSDSGQNVITGAASDVTLTNVDNTISGAGQLGAGQLTVVNQGTIDATGTNSLVIDTGTNVVTNSGTLEATGTGGLEVHSDLINTGVLWANGGNVTIDGNVSGSGTALISGSATLEFAGASADNTAFASGSTGTLVLDHAFDFSGIVSGIAAGNHLDLLDFNFANATLNYTANANGTGGTLSVTDGAHTANIALLGQYDPAGFQTEADKNTGTLISYHDHLA